MTGRRIVKYDFLQVSDEMLDERSTALGRLLAVAQRRGAPALEPLKLLVRLDRYVLRRVSDEPHDVTAEMEAQAFFPKERAAQMLAQACDWPVERWRTLVDALCDPEVQAMEPCPGGWRVRNIPERYARFANERKAARHRARDNTRARAAGWEPGEGKSWVNRHTGEVLSSLRDVMSRLEGP